MITCFVISFTIGPYYFGKNAALVIDFRVITLFKGISTIFRQWIMSIKTV